MYTVLKRLIVLALIGLACCGFSGSGGVWALRNGDFYATNFAGTAAGIQGAVTYLGATGGRIDIASGVYDFGSTSLTIPSGHVVLTGHGQRDTKFTYSGSGDFIVLGANDGAHTGTSQAYDGIASFVAIRDLWIQGPGKATAARGIVDWESGQNEFRNLLISDWGTGYFGLGADVSEFHNIYWSSNTYGAYLGSRCDQNTFDNNYFSLSRFGVYNEWSYGTRIVNSQFVFSDSADFVVDSRSDPTNGADTRNGSQRMLISGCWFEANSSAVLPRHLWLGRNGANGSYMTGLTVVGSEIFGTAGEVFVQVNAFSDVQLVGNGYSGAAFTFIQVDNVTGITQKIDDLWNHMASTTTRIAGAGPVANFTSLGDSLNIRLPTEWRGSNGNIDIPTTGDRINFTGTGAQLINASNGSGVVRLQSAGTTRLEANTTGVSLSNGNLFLNTTAHANLGSPANGAIIYCTDCTKATPCASGGSGALAKRINGAWDCD